MEVAGLQADVESSEQLVAKESSPDWNLRLDQYLNGR